MSIGITPARAGKRPRLLAMLRNSQDHPRACGEKSLFPRTEPTREGSPPRVRGKVTIINPVQSVQRITPARAGKSWITSAEAVI